jgi:hypothetical protein
MIMREESREISHCPKDYRRIFFIFYEDRAIQDGIKPSPAPPPRGHDEQEKRRLVFTD